MSVSQAHEMLRKDRGMALMTTPTPRIRAWQVDDSDGFRFVYHARSRGAAQAMHVKCFDLDFYDFGTLHTTRCYAMDGLPIDPWHVLATGVVSCIENGCPGCGATIYASQLERPLDEGRVLHDEATGEVFCRRECYARWRGVDA